MKQVKINLKEKDGLINSIIFEPEQEEVINSSDDSLICNYCSYKNLCEYLPSPNNPEETFMDFCSNWDENYNPTKETEEEEEVSKNQLSQQHLNSNASLTHRIGQLYNRQLAQESQERKTDTIDLSLYHPKKGQLEKIYPNLLDIVLKKQLNENPYIRLNDYIDNVCKDRCPLYREDHKKCTLSNMFCSLRGLIKYNNVENNNKENNG